METIRIMLSVAVVMAVMMFQAGPILAQSAQGVIPPRPADTPVGGPSGQRGPQQTETQLGGRLGTQGGDKGESVAAQPHKWAPSGGKGQLGALRNSWEAAAVRYTRNGMQDPRAYNAAYSRYEAYRDRYYSDDGLGGRRLQSWLRRQSIYNR